MRREELRNDSMTKGEESLCQAEDSKEGKTPGSSGGPKEQHIEGGNTRRSDR